MDRDSPPLVSGSTSRLDCLLDIWDSLLMQNKTSRPGMKTEAETETQTETETETETIRDVKLSAEGRSVSARDTLAVDTPRNPLACLGDAQLSVQDVNTRQGDTAGISTLSSPSGDGGVSTVGYSVLPDDEHDNSPSELAVVMTVPLRDCSLAAESVPNSVNLPVPPTVTVISDAGEIIQDSESSVNFTTRAVIPPGSLSVPVSSPVPDSSSPLSDIFPSPLSEPLSEPLCSPMSELSVPSTDSGVSEVPTDEPSSSLDLSITGESALSGGGDSTGDEAARGLTEPRRAGGGGRRAPRWRAAELRQRPLSTISTASSSSSSGGGSLPRSLVRRRPPRAAKDDVIDSAPGDLPASGITVSLPRAQSLLLDPCLTQADCVVAEIVQTEAVYVSDLREVIEGYLLFWRDNPESGIRDEHQEALFGNYQQIYTCNRAFLSALEQCRSDPLGVAKCFVGHRRRFGVYTEYCTHYPRAMSLLTELMRRGTRTARLLRERQVALRHTLPLGSYLLKPVQRILKYHLLLQSLMTHSMASPESHRQATAEALRAMRALAGHIDDMKRRHESAVRVQEVQSLVRLWQGDDLTTFGELLAEDTFRVPRAKMPRQVFLFEKMLLITKKRDDGTLVYKTHILCSNLMLIESVPGEGDSLQVLPFDDPREQYTLQARSVENKRQWALRLKGAILESYGVDIPKHARELVMKLGQHRENGEGLRRKMGRRTHSVPEYLERRKSVKRTTSAAGSVQQTARQQRQQRAAVQQQLQQQQEQQQEQQQLAGERADQPAEEHQPVECEAEEEQHQWQNQQRSQQQPHQQQQQQTGRQGQCTGRRPTPVPPCSLGLDCAVLWPSHGAPALPDVDEEELEEPSGDSRSSPHPSCTTSASSSSSAAAASAASGGSAEFEEDPHGDVQTIVERLVLQNKHFQRIMEKPRREVRRSPTSASESPSEHSEHSGHSEHSEHSERSEREPELDSCQEEARLHSPSAGTSEVGCPSGEAVSVVADAERTSAASAAHLETVNDREGVVQSPGFATQDDDEMPDMVPWQEDAPASAPAACPASAPVPVPFSASAPRRQPRTSPHTSPRHQPRPMSAITIESHDNIEYVSLFDYGARPVSVAVMLPPPPSPPAQPPPDRESRRRAAERTVGRTVGRTVERTVSEPCRRVARRLTKLHHSGQAELRQLVGGIRSRSMRLSRNLEDGGKGSTGTEEFRGGRIADMSRQTVCEEVSKAAAARGHEAAAEAVSEARRPRTWYCEASSTAELSEKVQQEEQSHQQQQQQQQQQRQHQRPQLKSFGSFRVLMRRSGCAGSSSSSGGGGGEGGSRSRWRPLSQLFETSKSRQRPPLASSVHAVSLQRLPTSDEQWQRPGVSGVHHVPPLAEHEVMSVTSLPTAQSHKYLPAPLDGGVRRLRQKLAGLVHGAPSEPQQSTGDLLGARLASSQLLESPLLTCERRNPLICSMTSLASSQSSSSDSDTTETEVCGSGGFYETGMDILEHIGVEVCF